MKSFATRAIAMTLFGAVAFTGLGASAVGASTRVNEDKFAGVYRVHVNWDGMGYGHGTIKIVLLGNGTGTDNAGNHISWTHKGRHLDFYDFDLNETFFIHGTAVRNRDGFSSRQDPGTLTHSNGHTAVWYAVKVRAAPGS
jgi:hypothetical protein